jgi:hypothetical protein
MAAIDKRALIHKLREDIGASVAVLSKAAKDAREAATHEEAKPENDKDTRAVEAAYLAGAQAERVRDLERVAASLGSLDLRPFGPEDRISSTALIELELEGVSHHYLLAPQGGGREATIDGVLVQVITPQSPLGRELLGKSVGCVVELKAQQKTRVYEIVGIS